MIAFIRILSTVLLLGFYHQVAFSQEAPSNRKIYPFKIAPRSNFPWIPYWANDVVARQFGNEWNGDGPTAVTFLCSPADLNAVADHFSRQYEKSSWIHGELPDREKRNVIPEFERLGFDKKLLPNGSDLDVLILPDSHYPFGPYVIIDRKAKRVWYLVIRT